MNLGAWGAHGSSLQLWPFLLKLAFSSNAECSRQMLDDGSSSGRDISRVGSWKLPLI